MKMKMKDSQISVLNIKLFFSLVLWWQSLERDRQSMREKQKQMQGEAGHYILELENYNNHLVFVCLIVPVKM